MKQEEWRRKRTRKITVTVTPMTAYHLEQIAAAERVSTGKVIDKLVRDRMLLIRDAANGISMWGKRF